MDIQVQSFLNSATKLLIPITTATTFEDLKTLVYNAEGTDPDIMEFYLDGAVTVDTSATIVSYGLGIRPLGTIVNNNTATLYNTGTFALDITPPDAIGGINAVASVTMLDGTVSFITVDEYGSGYLYPPTVTLTSETTTGTTATFEATLVNPTVYDNVYSSNTISALATKEQRQLAKLELARLRRQAAGDTTQPYYRQRNTYDITELPTRYSGDDVQDNPNPDGLILGRPWTTSTFLLEFRSYNTSTQEPGSVITSCNEGDTIWFDAYGTGVPDDPNAYLQLGGANITNDDGYFPIPVNLTEPIPFNAPGNVLPPPPIAGVPILIAADNLTEGNETLTAIWVINSTTVASTSISIVDTSLTPNTLLVDIDPNDLACYPGSGTLLTDLTGNGNNVTMVGDNVSVTEGVLSIQSVGGNWAEFPSNTFPWGNQEPFTIHCWFQTVGLNSVGTLFGTSNAYGPFASGSGWAPTMYVGSDGKMYVSAFWHGGTTLHTHVAQSSSVVNDTYWRLITVTFDSGTQTVYINGVQDGDILSGLTQTLYSDPTYYYLGAGPTASWPADPSNNPLSCNIGKFRFYTEAKDATDVLNYFNSTKSGYSLPPITYTVKQFLYDYSGLSGNTSLYVLLSDYPDAGNIPVGATATINGIPTTVSSTNSSNSVYFNGGTGFVLNFNPSVGSISNNGTEITFSWAA